MRPSASRGLLRTGLPRTGLLGAALLGAVALLAACGPKTQGTGGSRSASPHVSSAATATRRHHLAEPAHVSTSASVTGCATSALKVALAVGARARAAGSIYYPIDLTNTSGSTCTLFGYPGVSFVTGPSGTQIGRAATRNPVCPRPRSRSPPAQTAHATSRSPRRATTPAQCKPVTRTGCGSSRPTRSPRFTALHDPGLLGAPPARRGQPAQHHRRPAGGERSRACVVAASCGERQ